MDDPHLDENDDGKVSDRPYGTPRWVKVSAIIAAVIVVIVVLLLVIGGHGPRRHSAPSGAPYASPTAGASSI